MKATQQANDGLQHGIMRGRCLDGFLCLLAVLATICILHPAAEMPFIDESFYAKSALSFAQTGRINYYGSSPMIGWQMLWGAAWIKLAGFTFYGLRSSMLPFAGGAVWLMHSCLRRFRFGRREANLGALTLGWSALFVPLSTTFMTDIGALCGVLLCLWMCLRAVDADTAIKTISWLTAATFVNLLVGTDRQIVLLGALVMVPSTACLLRRRRGVLVAGVVVWMISLIAVQQALHWLSKQTGVRPIQLTGAVGWNAIGHAFLQFFFETPLCLTLLILPVAILALAGGGKLGKTVRLRTLAVTFAAAVVYGALALLASKNVYDRVLMPWLTPIVGSLGIFSSNDELPGVREATLGLGSRTALSLLTIGTLWAVLEQAWAEWRDRNRRSDVDPGFGWRTIFWTIGAFSAAYVGILVPTQLHPINGYFDRYLIFLIPTALICVLKLCRKAHATSLPLVSYITLAVMAIYVVMATHDWYAMQRARVALVDRVRDTGVAKTAILAGWEYDAWTQMEAQEFINFKLMVRPPGQVYTKPPERKRPCERGMVDWTPAIDPKFVVAYSPVPCFVPSEFAPARYRTWLPPFDRKLEVMRVPDDQEVSRRTTE